VRVVFRRSFVRDLRDIGDPRTRDKIRFAIEAVERAARLHDVPNLKRLSGPGGYFRIRIGDYRIGIAVEGDAVEFVRVLHRREIYRRFP
jgi:mRNA interferase RelE/StbE